MPDLTPDTIAEAATQPASAMKDGQSAAAVPIPDQIAADKYRAQAAQAATGRSAWGKVRMARAVPPGAT